MTGFLEGKFDVRCNKGHVDRVTGITRNHDCEHDGCDEKSVDNGNANVVCPNGHTSHVSGITRDHACPVCNLNCRLP